MRNYLGCKELSNRIKTGLQIYNEGLRKEKSHEQEYWLFNQLAELYLLKRDIREYPKVIAIYQYLHQFVDKVFKETENERKHEELDRNIWLVEKHFLEQVTNKNVSTDDVIKSIEKGKKYKDNLKEYRKLIKVKLQEIENLGVVDGQEELDEVVLKERAAKVKVIYSDISEFFIGKRDEAGELTEKKGLINELLQDCIEELGGIPLVTRGERTKQCEYAIFGMGSMSLGTITPWSDIEFGILIEDGLAETEEKNVKKYFRNLTTLLHIKVVNFGETPLRMMGIEELNNFRTGNPIDDWFFDELIKPGFSFDGPHSHACKTPLGRKGFKNFQDYELIATPSEMVIFQKEGWFQSDWQLMQALTHVVFITGNQGLLGEYSQMINQEIGISTANHRSIKQIRAEKILLHDFNAYKMLPAYEEEEGKLYNVKKEIYRLPDRLMAVLSDYYGVEPTDNWSSIEPLAKNKRIDNTLATKLFLAVSIASELRLRTYSENGASIEDLSAIIPLENKALDNRQKDNSLGKLFYLKNLGILYEFYYAVLPIQKYIANFLDTKFIDKKADVTLSLLNIDYNNKLLITAEVHKRFFKYQEGIHVLEELLSKDSQNAQALSLLTLLCFKSEDFQRALEINQALDKTSKNKLEYARLLIDRGNILGKLSQQNQQALKCLQDGLRAIEEVFHGEEHPDVAASYHNIGKVLGQLGRYEEALVQLQLSINILEKAYPGEIHIDIAASYYIKGKLLQRLERFAESLECYQKSLKTNNSIYHTSLHPNIANLYYDIGITLCRLSKPEKGLKYLQQSLAIWRILPLKNSPSEVAALLNNIGKVYGQLGDYVNALEYLEQSEKMMDEIYNGVAHPDIVQLNFAIAEILEGVGREKEAIQKYEKSLRIARDILENTPESIMLQPLEMLVYSLARLGRLYQSQGDNKQALTAKIERLGLIIGTLSQNDPERYTFKHNLACYCHALAVEYAKLQDNINYQEYLNKTKQTFEEVLSRISANNIAVDYAQFLILYHDTNNTREYDYIVSLLTRVIHSDNDSSELFYDQVDKGTLVKPLQKWLEKHAELDIKPQLLAYYLLTKIHLTNHQYEKAQEVLEQFRHQICNLEVVQDLFDDSCRELEKLRNLKQQKSLQGLVSNEDLKQIAAITQLMPSSTAIPIYSKATPVLKSSTETPVPRPSVTFTEAANNNIASTTSEVSHIARLSGQDLEVVNEKSK